MSEEDIAPLDPRLVELLRSHAPPLRAPADALERVAERLAVAVPSMGGGNAGGSSGPGAGAPGHDGARSVAGKASGLLGAKAIVPLGLAFAIGGGTGAAVMHAVQKPVERVVYVVTPAPSVEPAARVVDSNARAVPVEDLPLAAPEPSRARTSPAPAPSASVSSDAIAGERRLLDEARDALRRGDPGACLEAVDRHQARHPGGALAEEREALAVSALSSLGRASDAKKRAALFVERYPTSLFRPAVEAAVSGAQDR
jgi:hypothetical protein